MAIEFRSDLNKLHDIDEGIMLAHIDLFHKNLPHASSIRTARY